MKILLSLLLSALMIFSLCTVSAFGAEKNDDTPIIVVTGFMQSHLYTEENGEMKGLWFPEAKTILSELQDKFTEILFSAIGKQPEKAGEVLGKIISSALSDLKCLPDGSSASAVSHYENNPATRNAAYFSAVKGRNKYNAYSPFINYICSEGYSDKENVFTFEYDGRADIITLAEELREFIKAVKEYTDSKKVSLIGISYGGQIIESYLHYYRHELDIKKAVLSVPSLEGTDFAYRLFSGKIDLAFDDMIDFVESVTGSDTELFRLAKEYDSKNLSRMLNAASPYVTDIIKYWSSVYTLSDTESYEELKEAFLDPADSAEIIERNDIIHYEIMPAAAETLRDCINLGIDVSITACTGLDLVLGGNENGDILLAVDKATGAYCTESGKRFSDGYKALGTNCSDPLHNHISPAMDIDASTAFLPENTWFVKESYHAMFQFEDYAMKLHAKLLCTDELKNVHSDPAFPQFRCSDNPHRGIYAEFDKSTSGYVTAQDNSFIIENISEETAVIIESITSKGMDISFPDSSALIKAGESAEFTFSGELPAASAKRAEITVTYVKLDDMIKYSRDFDFTIRNGASSDAETEITEDEYFDEKNISALTPFKKLVLNIFYPVKLIFFVLKFINTYVVK